MDRSEARKILTTYRPGIDDHDPQFAQALAWAQADAELSRWLSDERKIHAVLRRTLSNIDVPEELAQKIVRQRPIPIATGWKLPPAIRLAAAIAILASLAVYWFRPAPKSNLTSYEAYLTRLVSKGYRMSLETSDLNKIRNFLAGNQAPSDYTLPSILERTPALGCATLSWNGNPVSMLCFADNNDRKLFLFIVDRQAIPDAPRSSSPEVARIGDFSAKSWAHERKAYVLTLRGDPALLREYE